MIHTRKANTADEYELARLMVMGSHDGDPNALGGSAFASLLISLGYALESPNYMVFVVSDDREMAGYVVVERLPSPPWEHKDIAVASDLYVMPQHRNTKAAVTLLTFAVDACRVMGYESIRFFMDAERPVAYVEKLGGKLVQYGYELPLDGGEK